MSPSSRKSLWSADASKDYWRGQKNAEAQADAERKGEPVAERIDGALAELSRDERDFVEFLVLSGIRKFIAEHDADLFKRLVALKLLQLRPGVGTRFMHDYQTSFAIPDAIWETLRNRRGSIFNVQGRSNEQRLNDLESALAPHLDGITPITQGD